MTTTSRSERRRSRVGFALIAALSLAACSGCGQDEDKPAGPTVTENLAPVPEPEGVAGELFILKPDQTWKRLRTMGGGPLTLMPQNYAVMVATLLGLPMTTSGAFDSEVATAGVLVSPAPNEISVVLGIHTKSGRELVAALSTGNEAKYSAKLDQASGVTLLEPKPGRDASMAMGVIGNHLITAPKAELVTRFGPYVARTLSTRVPAGEGVIATVPKKALSGPIARAARERWKAYRAELEEADRKNREKHGGRAPDFGDPAVALGGIGSSVESLIAALESSRQAKFVMVPHAERLEAKLELEPEPNGKASELVKGLAVGDLASLLALPKSTSLAIANRTTAADREESAKSMAETIGKLFGDRMTDADRKKLESTLSTMAAARGDESIYGLVSAGEQTALVYTGTVADEKRFDSGIKAMLELVKLRPIAEPLKQFAGSVTIKHGSQDVAGIEGKVKRAELVFEPSDMNAPKAAAAGVKVGPRTFELLWLVQGDRGYVALSTDADASLAALVNAKADGTLGAVPTVKAGAARIGEGVSFTLFAEPLRFGIGSAKSSSPVFVSLGKTGNTGWVKADAEADAVRALVRRFVKL